MKYKYYFNSSKSSYIALSMYKGRSMMIIFLIGDHRFLFASPNVQEAYNIIIFLFLIENSILKMFGSVDVKITPDFLIKEY